MKIIHNRVRCELCGDVIESKYRHDYKRCSCGNIAVDGGNDYLRRVIMDNEGYWTELSEYEDDE